jgi:hypothetical protein
VRFSLAARLQDVNRFRDGAASALVGERGELDTPAVSTVARSMQLRGEMRLRAALLVAVALAGPARAYRPGLVSIEAGGGFGGFTQPQVAGATSLNGTWNARLTVGARWIVAGELFYAGTRGNEQGEVGGSAGVMTESFGAALRVNVGRRRWQPFAVAGVGWINFHSYGRDQSPFADLTFGHNSNGLAIPLGAGLAWWINRHALVDARATYQLVSGARNFTIFDERLDLWSVSFGGGWAF